MKRYKETRLSEFFSKISDSKTTSNRPTLDTSAVTAETAVVANEGSFSNATDLIDVGGVVNYSVVNNANNPNDSGLAVGANLSDVDKLRFLADFYTPRSLTLHVAYSDTDRPSSCLQALAACSKTFYPHIHVLLQIFASLPISTATPERTFSAMKFSRQVDRGNYSRIINGIYPQT